MYFQLGQGIANKKTNKDRVISVSFIDGYSYLSIFGRFYGIIVRIFENYILVVSLKSTYN
jgi:hypothetical protein